MKLYSLIQQINMIAQKSISSIPKCTLKLGKESWPTPNSSWNRTEQGIFISYVKLNKTSYIYDLWTPWGQIIFSTGGTYEDKYEVVKTLSSLIKMESNMKLNEISESGLYGVEEINNIKLPKAIIAKKKLFQSDRESGMISTGRKKMEEDYLKIKL